MEITFFFVTMVLLLVYNMYNKLSLFGSFIIVLKNIIMQTLNFHEFRFVFSI